MVIQKLKYFPDVGDILICNVYGTVANIDDWKEKKVLKEQCIGYVCASVEKNDRCLCRIKWIGDKKPLITIAHSEENLPITTFGTYELFDSPFVAKGKIKWYTNKVKKEAKGKQLASV